MTSQVKVMAQNLSTSSIPEEGFHLTELGTNVRRLVQQNSRLLEALRETTGHGPQELQFKKREEQKTEYKRIWLEEILPVKVNDGNSHLHRSFRWIKKELLARRGPSAELGMTEGGEEAEMEEKNDE